MATFTAYSAFNYNNIIEFGDNATISTHTSTTLVAIDTTANPDVTYTLTGTGFTYDAWGLATGNLTGVTAKLGSANYFTTSNFSYNLNNNYYDSGVLVDGKRLYGMAADYSQWFTGNDTINGSAYDDVLGGFAGSDKVYGNNGNDTLEGWSGNDTLNGGNGDDYLVGQAGTDSLVGGAGWDVAGYTYLAANTNGYTIRVTGTLSSLATVAITNNATQGVAATTLETDSVSGLEQINGSNSRDYIYLGTAGQQEGARGYAGNDTIVGGSTSVTGVNDADFARYDKYLVTGSKVIVDLSTTTATARVYNGSGALTEVDTLIGINGAVGSAGNDSMKGGSGNDWFRGLEGNDTFVGGAGFDWIDYKGNSSALNITLSADGATLQAINAGAHGTDRIQYVENIAGGNAADALTGNNLNNNLRGNGGNDTLTGGVGTDFANYKNATSGVTVTWSSAVSATASSISDGNDVLRTIEGAYGSDYADRFTGNAGNEVLFGRAGNDTLNGGAGIDLLDGGRGADALTGGFGNDIFQFSGGAGDSGPTSTTWDTITDFKHSEGDVINLSQIDANTLLAGDQAFTYMGVATSMPSFTTAGHLKLYNGVLYGNTDTDAGAEFAIKLTGVTSLVAGDISL